MKRDLKDKLLLFSFIFYVILNVESTHEVNGTSEENITVEFTLQDPFIRSFSSKLNLYKNGDKKGSCERTQPSCSEKFVLRDVENSTVTLHITNLTLEDEGIYHVVVHADGQNPLIESNRVHIKVIQREKTTKTVPVYESVATTPSRPETPEQKSFLVFFTISVLIIIGLCLFVGILCWFYRTHPRKTDAENPPVQNNSPPPGQCGRSGAVFVSCVEYGELDFQNRPQRDDRVKPANATSKEQDGVEYAAIIFPQQKQTPCGWMRNKQQVP